MWIVTVELRLPKQVLNTLAFHHRDYAFTMIQTGLIQGAHDDLVTDASYDYYGQRLATCSLDQRYGCLS